MVTILGIVFWVAIIWMIVIACQNEQWGWAIGMFFIFPVSYVYGALHWDRAKTPFIMSIATIALSFLLVDF